MRVLVLIPGPLGERMSAPEVRGWNMALELRREHEVTIAAPASTPGVRDGVSVIGVDRRGLIRAARRADAVVGVPIPPYLYAMLATRSTIIVADLYNPLETELAGRAEAGLSLESRLRTSVIRASDSLQLKFADIVLCAVEAQRLHLGSQIAAKNPGSRGRPLLRVVPFGIDNAPPPPSARTPIRERFPAIQRDDPIVMWWGNVWRWFDAETALRAFAEVVRDVPNAKLVFTGGRPPRSEASELDETDAAREMARGLGLLGESVYFLDEWIPHAARHEYLQEADVGLTLHRDTPEKLVAARGRYMDYMWARLPCVLGAGDELADRFARQGFASVVSPGDVTQAASDLRRLLTDPAERSAARAAADQLLDTFRWSSTVAPLRDALRQAPAGPRLRRQAPAALASELVQLYAWRLAWEGARVLARPRGQRTTADVT